MLRLAIACLVIAIIAAVLGFGGLAGTFAEASKILFYAFLAVAAVVFVGAMLVKPRSAG